MTRESVEVTGMITFTVVYDNNEYDEDLTTDWGFSCLIEHPEVTILFDTGGKGDLLLANLEALGKDPAAVDLVALSHAHGDHTGGLSALLDGVSPTVALPAAFPTSFKRKIRHLTEVVEIDAPQTLLPGVITTGLVSGPPVEQALAVQTAEGWVVVTGCAHPGVERMTQAAKEAGAEEIVLVVGGFHLGKASDERIEATIDELQVLGVRAVAPLHCTGDKARRLFADAFGDDGHLVGVGASFTFEAP
jgi:7,8-dihydropterin-6-yl-methyl-4-(beta-D-ribofuranosyl)aminobenzene 5'-phosphate synthase